MEDQIAVNQAAEYVDLSSEAKEGDVCPAGDGGKLILTAGWGWYWLRCSLHREHVWKVTREEAKIVIKRGESANRDCNV